MEQIIELAPFVIGGIITWIVNIMKYQFGKEVMPKSVALFFAIVFGVAWWIFQTLLPPETQNTFIEAIVKMFSAAVAFYEITKKK